MRDRTTLFLTVASFSLLSLGFGMVFGKHLSSSEKPETGVFSGPVLVVDPVAINTSIREFLLKKRIKYGEKGLMEEIGIGKRTAKAISEVSGGRPVFVLQAIPNCLAQRHGESKGGGVVCIDLTDKVLDRLGLHRAIKSKSTFEDAELKARMEVGLH